MTNDVNIWTSWRAAWRAGMESNTFIVLGDPGDTVALAVHRMGWELVTIGRRSALAYAEGRLYFVADRDGWPTAVEVDAAIGGR